jgi:hypothetical protein
MATLSTVLAFARAQAQTDNNGLTDTKGIIFANEALLDFHREMITHGVDSSGLQEAYTSGTANQGTYLYPTDLFFLKAIEVNFTDTTEQNYIKAEQIDVSNLAGDNSFSWLRQNQTTQRPKFDDRGDWFEIFPTPTSSNNLVNMFRIFYFQEPTEYTSTSDVISYPVSLDYRILGWRIASSYLKSLGSWESAVQFDNEYTQRIQQLIKTLSRGVQTPMQATPIQLNGWEF